MIAEEKERFEGFMGYLADDPFMLAAFETETGYRFPRSEIECDFLDMENLAAPFFDALVGWALAMWRCGGPCQGQTVNSESPAYGLLRPLDTRH